MDAGVWDIFVFDDIIDDILPNSVGLILFLLPIFFVVELLWNFFEKLMFFGGDLLWNTRTSCRL